MKSTNQSNDVFDQFFHKCISLYKCGNQQQFALFSIFLYMMCYGAYFSDYLSFYYVVKLYLNVFFC